MIQKFIAFFMGIIAFFMQLLGIAPKPQPAKNYAEYLNVPYGTEELQVLDLYLPAGKTDVPVIVFIHGGGWIGGAKESYTFAAEANAKKAGIAAASINYRFINENVHCDELMSDVTAALAKIKEYAASKGVSINKAALCGYSAGAHMSLLYAYKYAASSPIEIKFVASQAGPSDLNDINYLAPENTMAENDLGIQLFALLSNKDLTRDNYTSEASKKALAAVSPVTYVNKNSVPTIICHGRKDITVPFTNGEALDRALTAAGVHHDFIIYENSDHGLDKDPAIHSTFVNTYDQYCQKYFK